MKNIAIVGAGFSGAVVAQQLAEAGCRVTVFDSRPHVAGNCHTQRDGQTNVMVHTYGPHIFHTSNKRVWDYVQQFGEIMPFVNRVKAIHHGKVYSLPINLMTINSFFGKTFSPTEAASFLTGIGAKSAADPKTFEEQALRFVGRDLYEAFFKGYTQKQWGIHPSDLPASILKRLPIRFNYDDNYYDSTFQGIPRQGYTHIVESMLKHPLININLNVVFDRTMTDAWDHVFYSGPIDAWFDYTRGRLAYRTLDFEVERHAGDYQGVAVMNYCDQDVPYTRISEHKHFSPWEHQEQTTIYKEYSRLCEKSDTPYYPVRLVSDKSKLTEYVEMAQFEKAITFVGRLGTYRYLDMHVSIAEALNVAERYLSCLSSGQTMPVFNLNPLN